MSKTDPTRVALVAGAPGSGKSTLGEALAPAVGAALLDLDAITNPLLDRLQDAGLLGARHWNEPALREVIRPARYAALREAVSAQPGRVVAVAPWTAELAGGAAWGELVAACGGEPLVVWLRADGDLLRDRRAVRGLDRDAHAVDPIGAPAVVHLAVDAALPTADQVALVRRLLGW